MAQESVPREPGALADVARDWLRSLERCVRTLDYEAARVLFSEAVVAFGTYAGALRGRSALKRQQWQNVWPHIRGFTFRLDELQCLGGPQGLCVIVPWDSLGVKTDGTTLPRPGRATIFLVPEGGEWVAIHSHFSLAPPGEWTLSVT